MSDDELVELWAERAAIIEEGCSSDVFWKIKSAEWRRWEAERLAFWEIRKRFSVARMPAVTGRWQKEKKPG